MTRTACEHEAAWVPHLARTGRIEAAMQAHVQSCDSCRELAGMVTALRAESMAAQQEAVLPTASQVWWRARVRSRLEAAQMAERPINVVQSLAAAALAGLAVSLISGQSVLAMVRHVVGRVEHVTSGGVPLALLGGASPLTWALVLGGAAIVLLMPIAVLLAASRD